MVYEARLRGSEERVALKKISKKHVGQEDFAREMTTLRAIHDAGGHCNIAGVQEIFEDSQNFFVVMELVSGGEMFEHLCRNGPYSEAKASAFMQELAHALAFLHAHRIVHADLKPENLMLSSWDPDASRLKVVDFGCSLPCGRDVDLRSSPLGTWAYLPPEALGRGLHLRVEPSLDMWSAGLILYIMLSGRHPFDPAGTATDQEVVERIRTMDVPLDGLGDDVSDSAKDLIGRLMAKDPADRLTAQQMLEHPWVQGRTALEVPLEGSDTRLAQFQEVLRQKLEDGFLSVMVARSMSESPTCTGFAGGYTVGGGLDKPDVGEAVDAMRRAYEAFDKGGKGKVSVKDIVRVMAEQGSTLSAEEGVALQAAVSARNSNKHPPAAAAAAAAAGEGSASSGGDSEERDGGLDLEEFERLLSNLTPLSFPAGAYVFREGDPADAMYFITSGKVEVLVEGHASPGQEKALTRVDVMGAGDFFGEGGLVLNAPRSASIRAVTPIKLIRVEKDSCQRMLKTTGAASSNLREVAFSRQMVRTKALLRALNTVRRLKVRGGEVVVRQGEVGKSMYTIVDGNLDVIKESPPLAPRTVAVLKPGSYFGEMAVLLKQPRNATVACSRDCEWCVINEVSGAEFLKLLMSRPSSFRRDVQQLMRARQFRHGVYKLLAAQEVAVPSLDSRTTFSTEELRAVFDAVDVDGSGEIELSELTEALFRVDSGLTEEGVREIIAILDLDASNTISFEEFVKIISFDP
eukprot:TRINITY_DN5797_c0_g1_i1.p1 TRINITY_DN5797_c0_g1~~TRINITY_DN5797_c0_g1_i1.p1  ORF type:complete len:745 (+),score=306.50 TRINITY_DN5797_c0_g1_i1:85-2319(+)